MVPALSLLMSLYASPVPEVVQAERSFAASAQEIGVAPAFRSFIADDGLIFHPDPVPGKKVLETLPRRPGTLQWWPVFAGAARSGDLGFTTGPFVSTLGGRQGQGHYFTVWRKQGDGSWRWIVDHGVLTDTPSPLGPETEPVLLPVPEETVVDGSRGTWAEVEQAEAALAAALALDATAAFRDRIVPEGRLIRQGPQPAIGSAAIARMLETQPQRLNVKLLGGAVSKAGDLAFTYGDARWNGEDAEKRGHYIRIWQHRKGGWALVVDALVPVPEPHR